MRALLASVAAIALATPAFAADCSAGADEVNAKCYPGNLQAAIDAAVTSDRPLVLPRGTYQGPVTIDYTAHAGTGFELISRGATIEGGLAVECQRDCFYFHQEGTLFVSGQTSGYLVTIGKPDFSDPQNSIKIDHMIVNNGGSGGAVQLNYVLSSDLFIVADSAGNTGLDLTQVQFSTIKTSASAANGSAMRSEKGYVIGNSFVALDLEASPVCFTMTTPYATGNVFFTTYNNCTTTDNYTPGAWGGNQYTAFGTVTGGAVQQTMVQGVEYP